MTVKRQAILATIASLVVVGAALDLALPEHSGAERTTAPPRRLAVTAPGRLLPHGGVIRIAGPSRPALVIARLLVAEGDRVQPGQVIAVLDSQAADAARVRRIEAELRNARGDLDRYTRLLRDGVAAAAERDPFRLKVDVIAAELEAARAELDMASVRTPAAGRVLRIHAKGGERVGPEGIAEIGATDEMEVVAEVYETDVASVHVGQHVVVTSPALADELTGTVARIGVRVGPLDLPSTDPAAITDARVVEVTIRVDDPARVADLTNLQVEVAIEGA